MGNIALGNISLNKIGLSHKHPSTHSPDFNPDVELLEKHYRTVNSHYGNVKLVRDKNTLETMLLKEIFVNSKEAFEQELRFFNNRIALKHPNIVDIIGFTSEETKNLCSNYFKVSVFFEVLEQDLQTDLGQRIKEKNFYSENELLLIADNLISALSYFQNQGHAHGDIRPFNIFVKGNCHKLSDPSLNPRKLSNGLTLAIVEGAKALLAPELLEQIPQSQFEIKTDMHKADVFSLGATLLGLATLTQVEDIYDYKAGTINIYILEERLTIVRNNYSVLTYDLIKSMLTIEVNERPDFVVFINRLLPYQEEIRSLRPLSFTDSTKITLDEPVHINTQIHEYDTNTHHHYEEIVRRTGPAGIETQTYTHDYLLSPQAATTISSIELLDAQIQAAIDRTRETLKNYGSKTTDSLSYAVKNSVTDDLTMNYLAGEKEKDFKTSSDYGISSTQPSYPPTAANYYSDVDQLPVGEIQATPDLQATSYSNLQYSETVEIVQSEGLLGKLLVQALSNEINVLAEKIEGEIHDYPEVATQEVVDVAVPENNVIIDESQPPSQMDKGQQSSLVEGQESNILSSLENKIEQEARYILIQEGEMQKSPEKKEEISSSSSEDENDVEMQPEDYGKIPEKQLEKEKLKEIESEIQSSIYALLDESAKEAKKIPQESFGRQEGEAEGIDQDAEQEKPPGFSEIQI